MVRLRGLSAAFLVAMLLAQTSCAGLFGPDPREAPATKALQAAAKDAGWPQNVYNPKDWNGMGLSGSGLGISVTGADTDDVDKAFVVLTSEKEATGFLDLLQENGMRRTSFHGYDAIIMSNGEKVCEAGGTVGFVLGLVRKGIVWLGAQMGTEVNPNDICGKATGTVAWTCGDVLFTTNAPGKVDTSMSVAESLYANAEKLRLCGGEDEVRGRVTDGHGDPMPYVKVTVNYNGKDWLGRADADGKYAVKVKNLVPDEDDPPQMKVKVEFNYERDGKNYFNIIDENNGGVLIWLEKTVKLEKDEDKNQDLDMMLNPAQPAAKVDGDLKSSSGLGFLHNRAAVYYHIHEALDFALVKLKADVAYKLPVDVHVGVDDGKTYYTRPTGDIYICLSDLPYGSTNRPDNREYHEFSHHIMFSQWNGDGLRAPGDVNHDGYVNTDTGDSYTEGFAEFTAMAISEYRGDKSPELYANFGSFENNYKAWSWAGKAEELAVAGILWDLYDKDNDKGDTMSIPLDEMWPILKVKRANFYEYYLAFKAAYPKKSGEIDAIFREHGFFADTDRGNGQYDIGEAYRDLDGDKVRGANEPYVDYGTPAAMGKPWMVYTPGETIGKATNYERENRSLAVRIPGAYLKVSDTQDIKYRVFVHFASPADGRDYDYPVEVGEGMIYVQPLPEDVDATITVKPDSKDYTSSDAYTVTTKDYIQKYYAEDGKGYIDSHTFGLKPTGSHADPPYGSEGAKPRYDTDAGYDGKPAGGACCLPGLTVLLAALAAAATKALIP
jgi:hypothetical protein